MHTYRILAEREGRRLHDGLGVLVEALQQVQALAAEALDGRRDLVDVVHLVDAVSSVAPLASCDGRPPARRIARPYRCLKSSHERMGPIHTAYSSGSRGMNSIEVPPRWMSIAPVDSPPT